MIIPTVHHRIYLHHGMQEVILVPLQTRRAALILEVEILAAAALPGIGNIKT